MTHYTDKNEDLDDFRPMTKEESIEAYREIRGEEPQALADLYIDFHDFRQAEFLIFKDRLSAAVLIADAAQCGIGELVSKLEARQQDGSYLVPGWETESGDTINESLGIADDASKISIGATILTAAAALESLLIDLAPESRPRLRGLQPLLQAFLLRHAVPDSGKTQITQMGKKVGDLRNTFAHTLIGSYWATDPSVAAMFTPDTMAEVLFTVGRIAVLMEQIVLGESRACGG